MDDGPDLESGGGWAGGGSFAAGGGLGGGMEDDEPDAATLAGFAAVKLRIRFGAGFPSVTQCSSLTPLVLSSSSASSAPSFLTSSSSTAAFTFRLPFGFVGSGKPDAEAAVEAAVEADFEDF